jgi:threonine synthase
VHGRFGEVIDPHTRRRAEGRREHVEEGTPMIVLETALPAKFNATVREALGTDAPRPPGFEGIEALPRRFTTIAKDAGQLKALIAGAT